VADHKDGDESNGAPDNLRWLCKLCNTRLGLALARAGIGKRTRQCKAVSRCTFHVAQSPVLEQREKTPKPNPVTLISESDKDE
jgi:hypothetical protein